MIFKKSTLTLALLTLLTSISIEAAPTTPRMILAPACLTKNLNLKIISTKNNLNLISASTQDINLLITEKENQRKQKILCGGFIDVTDTINDKNTFALSVKNTTQYTISHQKEVNILYSQVNPENIWNNLTAFSQFDNRYANNDNGIAAANWIKDKVIAIANENYRQDITTTFIKTNGYSQPSLLVKIGNSNQPSLVIGSHMDTLDSSWFTGNRPGADDDGSGSMSALETFRALIASGIQFKNPIYFIWYAAEEEGLYGSQSTVAYFQKNKIPVANALQMDMTGFTYENDPSIWFMTDYVNKDLTIFLEKLVTTYIKQPVKESRCGYACSDHASWNKIGVPAAMPAEAAYENTNASMHFSSDTIDKLSLTHMSDFTKLGLAFIGELGEPV